MPGLDILEKFRQELRNLGNEKQVTEGWGEEFEDYQSPEDFIDIASQIDVDELLASIDTVLDTHSTEDPDEKEISESNNDRNIVSEDFLDKEEIATQEDESESSDLDKLDDFLSSLPLGTPEETLDISDEDLDLSETESLVDELVQDEISIVPDIAEQDIADLDLPEVDIGEQEIAGLDLAELNFGEQELDDPDLIDEQIPSEIDSLDLVNGMLDLGGEDPPLDPSPLDIDDFTEKTADEQISDTLLEDLDTSFFVQDQEETETIPETLAEFSDLDSDKDKTVSIDAELMQETEDLRSIAEEQDEPSFDMPLDDFLSDEVEETSIPSKEEDEFSNFVIPDDLITDSEEESDTGDLDGFEGFSFDENIFKESVEEGIPESDEFTVPGFTDFLSSSKTSLSELPAAVAARKTAEKQIPLEISEQDFQRFLEEVSLLPLNLRIAIQEFIVGETGTELQKMELVHHILTDYPIKKIVYALEKYLDRSIQIPRDYVRKSHADYEREKSSLKYIFFNKILPVASLVSIISILAACIFYLSYQFIYRPLAAESRYKRGFVAIKDERYTQSLELFDEAVKIWEKKHWYFTYAQEYKAHRQYISAETMYLRLLNRYKNDKQAGLEYANMLRKDLRNFEKAESILKRRLLDFHVNDQDGLLLLGDTYLDWAEEESQRYAQAKEIYTKLIELYGQKDPYLVRLMRYHIRTDNLEDVLPLKQHFTHKRAKIEAEDLIELSGYLLEKRYEPKPGDNEFLRSQIEDVRRFLERAVKADSTSPEAHYNMGRFLIYNYNFDLGVKALQESLGQFQKAYTMSPKRAHSYVDTYRLLGENLVEEKEYLKAQTMYLEGMSLYETFKENKAIVGSSKIGKLFADFADIEYFISNDFDKAQTYYQKAILESYDTPSIRYRLGFIQYRKGNFDEAMKDLNYVQAEIPNDKNALFGYANTMFKKENYYVAQAYYERLQELLEAERIRKGVLLPQIQQDHGSFVEEYMHNANNLGVTLTRIATKTGDFKKTSRALALFAESTRAWDALTRNQDTMVRAQGSNLAYLNMQNMTHPRSEFIPEIYSEIPKTLENEKILKQRIDE